MQGANTNALDIDLDHVAACASSAAISDICDSLGLRDQTAQFGLSPLARAAGTVVGWARPVRSIAVNELPERPYVAEIDFIDSLRAGDVVVAECTTGAAFWGDLFATAAIARGARGAIIDGYVRDSQKIIESGFRIHCRGMHPTDCHGRTAIVAEGNPVTVGGKQVQLGDLVIADDDGVTFVPRDHAEVICRRAIEKAGVESQARALLEAGSTLREAWERFRVL